MVKKKSAKTKQSLEWHEVDAVAKETWGANYMHLTIQIMQSMGKV